MSSPSESSVLATSCEREVRELHAFFEDWFCGRCAETDAAFSRARDALADDFVIVFPSGNRLDRAGILEVVRDAYGGRDPGEFEIRIEHICSRIVAPDAVVVEYVERHVQPGDDYVRRSVAVFRRAAVGPNGAQWVHVHEVSTSKADTP